MKDKVGIWASLICLIHCLIFPLLATTFPIFLKLDMKVEMLLLATALVVGSLSFMDNVIKHKYFLSLFFFLSGFLSIFVAVIYNYETLHFLGLIILIIAHYLNYKKIKKIDGPCPHTCKH